MTKKPHEIPLFPLSGWTIGLLKEKGALIFQAHYLATPFDTPDQAQQGLTHVMTPDQARELAQKLIDTAHAAETLYAEVAPKQKH